VIRNGFMALQISANYVVHVDLPGLPRGLEIHRRSKNALLTAP